MQASRDHQIREAHSASLSPKHRRTWPILGFACAIAVILLGGLAAYGSARGWRPASINPFAAAPDLTATAVTTEPDLRAVAVRSAEARIASLACACDRGLVATMTGSALAGREQSVAVLAREVRRRTTAVHGLHVDAVRLLTPTTGRAWLSADVSEWAYQGLVVEQRVDRSYRERDDLVLADGAWKVRRIHATALTRKVRSFSSAPATTAAAVYILDDTTGRPLYAYNANTARYMASTAKMVTALVAVHHLALNSYITVPPDAAVIGTTAGLAIGETLRVRDVFYGMLLPSGNDAAVTLADAVAGSVPAFAVDMNTEIAALHLTHSHFLTPHGLDTPGQYSTAHDLAWIAHALLRQPFLAHVVQTRHYRAVAAAGAYVHNWTNLNHLLGSYPGAIGVKTGTTPGAGANLVAATVHRNRRLIVVEMGDTVNNRFSDARRLLNYGWRLLGYRAR